MSKFKNYRLLALILITILTASLLLFVYLKRLNTAPQYVGNNNLITSNWKKIELIDGKVIINYPPSVYLEKTSEHSAVSLPEKGASTMNFSGLVINVSEKGNEYSSVIKEAEIYFKPYTEYKQENLSSRVTRLSGYLGGIKRVRTFVRNGGWLVELDWQDKPWSIKEEEFNQIADTVEFKI